MVLALSAAPVLAASDATNGDSDQVRPAPAGPELYRWLDRYGVVRYTPDLSRVPDSRRNTVIRVVPSTKPRAATLAAQPGPMTIPTPDETPPSATAALVDTLPSAEPFNAPGEARRVGARDLVSGTSFGGSSWPELDARIAELEILVARDEETIKQMISAPPSEDYDELIHSQELRTIAARLPILQGELDELRRWREEPDRR
jgi:uncharacterized coiled-coil protein SlyX